MLGTAILGANYASDGGGESNTYSASSNFDFAGVEGDLLLGLIDSMQTGFINGAGFQSMEFSIVDNGVDIFDTTFRSLSAAESFFHDSVIDLGDRLGPLDLTFNYNLVADGSGGFGFDLAVGGAVCVVIPETSTWAMILLGFAGLGFVGYRQTRGANRRRREASGSGLVVMRPPESGLARSRPHEPRQPLDKRPGAPSRGRDKYC